MLEELIVHNYALIEQLNVQFTDGFNIMTGETGAGKSILVGAIGLLLGLKADIKAIRTGSDEMAVSGVIKLAEHSEVLKWLKEHGITPEDHSIIIRRVVKKNGRGSILLQSSPITLVFLRELTGKLFDMHGQHEHQSLLIAENHRKLIDKYGECTDLVREFSNVYTRLFKLKEQLSALTADERERLRRIDLLRFSIKEIREANLNPEEEEQLKKEHTILSHHEKLLQKIENIYTSVSENRGGTLAGLKSAQSDMSEILTIDPGLKQLSVQLDNAFYELEDFTSSIGQYKSNIVYDPARLEQVDERLALINTLLKKYGNSIEEVLEYSEKSSEELERIENYEDEKREIETEIHTFEKELKDKADTLSKLRHAAAEKIQIRIEEELKNLGMPKAGFRVLVKDRVNESGKPIYSVSGKDSIVFMISPNQGEPFKPLVQIASGGELSRVMLAIRSVLARSDQINTLIFDEVDAGIGGEVALAVGEKLKSLSQAKQVLCITHLATLAARADNHIKVLKENKGGRTITKTEKIIGDQRREEIARMLAGDQKGEVSLKHAVELLTRYGN